MYDSTPFEPVPEGAWYRRRVVVLAAAAIGFLAVVLLVLRGAGAAPARDQAAHLQARAAALRAQLDLVKEEGRYLLLDPDAGTVTLFHGGAPLRSWQVTEVSAGARRWAGDEEGWRTRRWDGARIEPTVERDRRVIVSDSVAEIDLTGAVDWIPPTPEEAIPTPPRFVVHYQGGMGLEVLAAATDSAQAETGLLDRVEHSLRRLLPRNWDRYRIRVVMPAPDAGALYRALPDSSSLLAVIPDP